MLTSFSRRFAAASPSPRWTATRLHPTALAALLACAGSASAQEPSLPEVQVQDAPLQAASITTTYERSELLDKGDASLQEVLRRLPGVSVDSEGAISLRGMGQGRTLVLIDGRPLISDDGDISVNDMPLSMVERIDIVRGASAADPSAAIAGTIRIVTRRAGATPERAARLRLAFSPSGNFEHHASVNLGASHAQWQWQLHAEVSQKQAQHHKYSHVHTTGYREIWDGPDYYFFPIEDTHRSALAARQRLRQSTLGGDVALQATATDRLGLRWQAQWESEAVQDPERRELLQITPANTHHNGTLGETNSSRAPSWHLTPTLYWERSLANSGKLQAEWGLSRGYGIDRYQSSFHHYSSDTSTSDFEFVEDERMSERVEDHTRNTHASIQWIQPLNSSQHLQLGATWRKERLTSSFSNYEYGQRIGYYGYGPYEDEWDDQYGSARTTQAGYVQWGWKPSGSWSLQTGLRHERQKLASPAEDATQRRANSLWLPSLSLQFTAQNGAQWHLNLAKTYRAPNLKSLQDEVRQRSGDIMNPGLLGNPDLRNEVSTGLELGVRQALQRGDRSVGYWHTNLFVRNIRDSQSQTLEFKTITQCDDEGECWTIGPQWWLTPTNLGTTRVQGLEAGIRYDLPQAPLAVYADVVLTQSRVSGHAAPARLNGQTPLQLTMGWDARTQGTGLLPDQWGAQLRYESSYDTRLNPEFDVRIHAMTSWHWHAMWKLAPDLRLRAQLTHGSDWRTTAYQFYGRAEHTHIRMVSERPWQAALQLEHDF